MPRGFEDTAKYVTSLRSKPGRLSHTSLFLDNPLGISYEFVGLLQGLAALSLGYYTARPVHVHSDSLAEHTWSDVTNNLDSLI